MTKPTKLELVLQDTIVDVSTTSPSTSDLIFSLYVGDLEENVAESLLFDLFNEVRQVHSVRVCRDLEKGVSLGYGYVNFSSSDDANVALRLLNFKRLNGKQIRIMLSDPDPTMRRSGIGNVYIKNLDLSIDNKDLYETFCVFGNVSTCKVVVDNDGVSRGFGFVQFEKEEDAEAAIRNLNGMAIKGKQVHVCKFIRQEERIEANKSPKYRKIQYEEMKEANLYTKNLDETITNDEKLKALFSEFGTITSCKIMVDSRGVSKGFGFVSFSTREEAKKAMTEMNRKMVGRKPLYVSVAERKEERMARLQAHFAQVRASGSLTTHHVATSRIGVHSTGASLFLNPPVYSFTHQPIMVGIEPSHFMVPMDHRVVMGNNMFQLPFNVHFSGVPIDTGTLASVLVSATPENQRLILGKYLYPLVEQIEARNAAIVTGVLLEMGNYEVLNLIESPDELKKKVGEAMALLIFSAPSCVASLGDQFGSLSVN